MNFDLSAAGDFMATHARILDRRRFERLSGDGDPAVLLAALDAYRNSDGGYGWGLEPDLRSPESQPGAAHHAFEVFEEAATASLHAVTLCDWLESITLADGGLPFARPLGTTAGCAPWWAEADPSVSSLQITAATVAPALRLAAHDPAVAAHPWLTRATDYCLTMIEQIAEPPFAYVLAFSVRLLDALQVTDGRRAAAALGRLRQFVPSDGMLPVQGGADGEMLRPLDLAPFPDRPPRALIADNEIAADLNRLAALQEGDGGWSVDYLKISPAGSMEWRGYATVRAVDILRRNGLV
jgi:hypothetical protein